MTGAARRPDRRTCCSWSRWRTARRDTTAPSSCRCMRGGHCRGVDRRSARRVVDVHRTPAGDRYATVETHGPDDTVTLSLAPEITVALRRVFA